MPYMPGKRFLKPMIGGLGRVDVSPDFPSRVFVRFHVNSPRGLVFGGDLFMKILLMIFVGTVS